MTKIRYILLIFICLAVTGCAPVLFLGGAASGVAGYKYYEGALTVIYQAPYENTWNAAIKAAEEMSFKIEQRTQELTTGKITCKRSDGTGVKISLKYVSPEETEVSIRVGLFGDENASNVIKDKIGSILFK